MTSEGKVSPPPSPAKTDDYSPSRIIFSSNYPTQSMNNKISNFSLDKSDGIYTNAKDLNSIYATPTQSNDYNLTSQKSSNGGLATLHYKNFQSSTIVSSRGQTSPVNGFNQRINPMDTTQRKRYHTAPREKHRVQHFIADYI